MDIFKTVLPHPAVEKKEIRGIKCFTLWWFLFWRNRVSVRILRTLLALPRKFALCCAWYISDCSEKTWVFLKIPSVHPVTIQLGDGSVNKKCVITCAVSLFKRRKCCFPLQASFFFICPISDSSRSNVSPELTCGHPQRGQTPISLH